MQWRLLLDIQGLLFQQTMTYCMLCSSLKIRTNSSKKNKKKIVKKTYSPLPQNHRNEPVEHNSPWMTTMDGHLWWNQCEQQPLLLLRQELLRLQVHRLVLRPK
jgi:hypothetical protein